MKRGFATRRKYVCASLHAQRDASYERSECFLSARADASLDYRVASCLICTGDIVQPTVPHEVWKTATFGGLLRYMIRCFPQGKLA